MFTFPITLYASVIIAAGSTWDPAKKASGVTLSGGNLVASTSSAAGDNPVLSTSSKSSGKWYVEFTMSAPGGGTGESGFGMGNASTSFATFMGANNNSFAIYANGQVFVGGSNTATYGSFDLSPAGTIGGMAVDIGAQKAWWRVTSSPTTWNGGGGADPATGTGGFDFSAVTGPYFVGGNLATNDGRTVNFGGSSFNASAPSGFSAWG